MKIPCPHHAVVARLGASYKWFWLLPIGIIATTAVLLLLQSPARDDDASVSAQTLRIVVATPHRTLDPAFAIDAASLRLLRLLTTGLITLEDGRPTPAAATVTHKDYSRFTVTLAAKTFTDGTSLTAQWVADFYQRLNDPSVGSPYRGVLQDIAKIKVHSERQLSIELNRPNPYFWSALTLPLIHAGHGIGEYQIDTISQGKVVTLTARAEDSYWQQLELRPVNDPIVRWLLLRRGEVDLLYQDMPLEYQQYAMQQGYQVQAGPSSSYSYLGFNHRPERATANLDLRQKIAELIDKDAFKKHLIEEESSTKNIVLASNSTHKKGGYKNNNTTIVNYNNQLEMLVSSSYSSIRIGQFLQQQLQQAGFAVKLTPLAWDSLFDRLKRGDFDLYYLTWVGPFQADIYFRIFHSSQTPPTGLNRGFIDNKQLDFWLAQLLQQGPQSNLIAKIEEFQNQQLLDLPLWRRPHVLISKNSIYGCKINSSGDYNGLLSCRKY